MQPPRDSLLAALIVAACTGSFAYRVATAAPSASDNVGRLMSVYADAATMLRTAERIGFVAPGSSRADAGAARFAAQNAFAPKLIERDLEAATHVVSVPGAPAALDADPRLTSFELIGIVPDGIRIYRRRP